jgi:hypothetical protein
MARKVQTFLIDDLDGSEADGTIRFGLDGVDYEIDLNAAHAGELRDILASYAAAGRKITGVTWRPPRFSQQVSADRPSTGELRAWARAHGVEVKTRGRVPAGVLAEFQAWARHGDG